MNQLLVDMGNSRIKWMFVDTSKSIFGALSNKPDYSYTLSNFFNEVINYNIESIHYCSVISKDKIAEFHSGCLHNLGINAVQIHVTSQYQSLINGYQQMESLGVDRWVAMVGAYNRFKAPFVVCDCGTAVTIDVVDAKMKHLGGYIMPGINTMLESLGRKTAMKFDASNDKLTTSFGRSTDVAISNGIILAITSSIYSIMNLQAKQGILILTGGDAQRVAKYIDLPLKVEPDLVLHGLLDLSRN